MMRVQFIGETKRSCTADQSYESLYLWLD